LKDIAPRLISEYKSFCREKKFSPSTINSRRGFLNHAYRLAIREWEWVRENPVERVAREKVRNERDRWLTLEEEEKLLRLAVLYPWVKGKKQEPRYWLQEILFFALNTGMRQDEILSLEWSNVDLFRKTATVVRSKNGEKRTIPLNQRTFEFLKEKSKVRCIKSNWVFANLEQKKFDAANLLRAFYIVIERAGIKDFRFHDLRHTFATRLAQAGIDFYKISKLLGHKDIRMTQRYSHHYPESLRDGVEVLDRTGTNLAHFRSEERAASS
jgi:integrase